MAKTRKRPELRVAFDTNAIFNQSGHFLLRHEVYDLVKQSSAHADLAVTWYLPDVVRHERQYQMTRQATELLPAIQKVERLLGHNLAITEETITKRVADVIAQQIQDLSLQIIAFIPEQIEWRDLMLNAAYRRPPFAPGEKEKGFRDALIAEAFVSLVAASPTTPRVCRLVLLSGDDLLSEAVRRRTESTTNVHVLPTLEELKGLINTLASEVAEEFVNAVKDRATAYFFQKDNQDSLYYREKVGERLRQQHAKLLRTPPTGATEVELEKTLIGPARFGKKKGQRIQWVTRITIDAAAYRAERTAPLELHSYQPRTLGSPVPAISGGFDLTKPIEPLRYDPNSPLATVGRIVTGSELLGMPKAQDIFFLGGGTLTRKLVQKGVFAFEISWSVSISTNRQSFSSPSVDQIQPVDTSWEAAV